MVVLPNEFFLKIIFYISGHFLLLKISSSKTAERKEQTNKNQALTCVSVNGSGKMYPYCKSQWLGEEPQFLFMLALKRHIPFHDPLCCSHKGKGYIYFIAVYL